MIGRGVAIGSARRGVALGLAIALAATLALGSRAAAAPPYEPNDALSSAAGPIVSGQTYAAAIDLANDTDYYYFYVASTPSTEVALTVTNRGGGGAGNLTSDISVKVLDTSATAVGPSLPYIEKGESRTAKALLEPQKYFIEVAAGEGAYGDAYEFTVGAAGGLLGDYGLIAGRCAAATASVDALQRKLDRVESRLQRATSRLRRARYAGREARRTARSLYVKAKERVTTKRKRLKVSTQKQKPWCFIEP